MKTYKQFQENVASLVLRKGSRFLLPALATGIGAAGTLYQATKGNGESNFENLRKQQQAGKGEELKKKVESDAKKPSTREKIKNALVDASLNYRKGLSAGLDVEKTSSTGPIGSASDEFRKKEGKSPAQIARELIRKQKEQYKKERERNRKNELP